MLKITREHSKFHSSQPINIHVHIIVRYYTQNSQVCTHDTTNISFMEFLRMVKTVGLICVWRKVKRFQDSKFNISNITQAIHKMLQNLYLLCCEIMCEILSRLILYF